MNKPKRKYQKSGKYSKKRKSKILTVLGKETYTSGKIKTTNLNRIYSEGKNLSVFNKYWNENVSNIKNSINDSSGDDIIYKNLFETNYDKFRYLISLVHNTKENSQKYYDMYNMLYTIYGNVRLDASRVKIFTYGVRISPTRRETKFSRNMYVKVCIYEDSDGKFSDNSFIEVKLCYDNKNNDYVPVKVMAENKQLYYSDTNSKLNIIYEVLLNNNNFDTNILEILKFSDLKHQADNLWNSSMIVNYQNLHKSFELLNYKVCNISKAYNQHDNSDTFLRLEKCCEVSKENDITTRYNMYFDIEIQTSDSPEWISTYMSDVLNTVQRLVVTDNFFKKYLSDNRIIVNYLTIPSFIQILENNPSTPTNTNLMSISHNPSKNTNYYLLNLGFKYHLCNVTIVHKSYVKKEPYYNFFVRLEGSGLTRYTGPPKHEINLDNSNIYNFVAVISSQNLYDDFSKFNNAGSNELFFSIFEIKFICHNYSIINKSDKQPNLNTSNSSNNISSIIGPIALNSEKVIVSYNEMEILNPRNIFTLPHDSKYILTDFSRFYEIPEYSTIHTKITNVIKSNTMDGYYQLTFNDGSLFLHGYEFNTTNPAVANFLNPETPLNLEYTSNIFGSVFALMEQNKLLDSVPISTRLSSIDNYLSRYNIFSMSVLKSNVYVLEAINISSLYNPNAKIYVEINSPGLTFYDKYSTVVYMDNSPEHMLFLINQCIDLDLNYIISSNTEKLNILDYDVVFAVSVKYKEILFDLKPKLYSMVVNLHLYNNKMSSNVKNDIKMNSIEITDEYLLTYTSKILSSINSNNISEVNIISYEVMDNIPVETISKLLYHSEYEFTRLNLDSGFSSSRYSYNIDKINISQDIVEIVENFYSRGYNNNFRLSDQTHKEILGCMKEYMDHLNLDSDTLFKNIIGILSIKDEKSDVDAIASFIKLNVNVITKGENNILKRLYSANNYYNNIYIYLDNNGLYRLCWLDQEYEYFDEDLDYPKNRIITGNKGVEYIQNILNPDLYEGIIFELKSYLDDKTDDKLSTIINVLKNNLERDINQIDIQKHFDEILDAEPNVLYLIFDNSAKFKLYYHNIQTNITVVKNSSLIFVENDPNFEKSTITVYNSSCIIVKIK